jgi:hypothetical protein
MFLSSYHFFSLFCSIYHFCSPKCPLYFTQRNNNIYVKIFSKIIGEAIELMEIGIEHETQPMHEQLCDTDTLKVQPCPLHEQTRTGLIRFSRVILF